MIYGAENEIWQYPNEGANSQLENLTGLGG